MYLEFASNDNGPGVGFRATFHCSGTLMEYWKPADVAISMELAVTSSLVSQAESNTACLSDVL
eukprot:COSAG04_NODE_26716_length_291_cov_1.177083_1_plen_62_part_10